MPGLRKIQPLFYSQQFWENLSCTWLQLDDYWEVSGMINVSSKLNTPRWFAALERRKYKLKSLTLPSGCSYGLAQGDVTIVQRKGYSQQHWSCQAVKLTSKRMTVTCAGAFSKRQVEPHGHGKHLPLLPVQHHFPQQSTAEGEGTDVYTYFPQHYFPKEGKQCIYRYTYNMRANKTSNKKRLRKEFPFWGKNGRAGITNDRIYSHHLSHNWWYSAIIVMRNIVIRICKDENFCYLNESKIGFNFLFQVAAFHRLPINTKAAKNTQQIPNTSVTKPNSVKECFIEMQAPKIYRCIFKFFQRLLLINLQQFA